MWIYTERHLRFPTGERRDSVKNFNLLKSEVSEVSISSISHLAGWLLLIVFADVLALRLGFADDKQEKKRALIDFFLFGAGVLAGALYF